MKSSVNYSRYKAKVNSQTIKEKHDHPQLSKSQAREVAKQELAIADEKKTSLYVDYKKKISESPIEDLSGWVEDVNASYSKGFISGGEKADLLKKSEERRDELRIKEIQEKVNKGESISHEEAGKLAGEDYRKNPLQKPETKSKDEWMKKDTWSEQEVNLAKRRLNDKKTTHDELFKTGENEWENKKLTQEQQEKGRAWVYNQYKSPTGKVRDSNPFGEREEDIINNYERIEIKEFYNAGNSYHDYYVPLYVMYSKDGDSMEYYVSGGKINVIG